MSYSQSIESKDISKILAPISLGELIDKITILEIKVSELKGLPRKNVQRELSALLEISKTIPWRVDKALHEELRAINRKIWDAENSIRDCEQKKDFGINFINLSRLIYTENDLRASVKRQINIEHGSFLVEEKSYNNLV